MVIGNASIEHLVLRPGNHSLPVRGILDFQKIIGNLSEILATQQEAIKNGYLDLKVVGTGDTFDGAVVPYYDSVLKKLTLSARVSITGLLTNTIGGITHNNLTDILSSLNFTGSSGPIISGPDLIPFLNDKGLVTKLLEDYIRC